MRTIILHENREVNNTTAHPEKSRTVVRLSLEPGAEVRLPEYERFTLLVYRCDFMTKVEVGCTKYPNCSVITTTKLPNDQMIMFSSDEPEFYPMSQIGKVRSDRINNLFEDL